MAFARGQDALEQQLQEERLARLCDDNAFVNVEEVLKRQRCAGAAVGAADVEVNFLEPSGTPSAAPPRVHLSRCLMEQHRAYLKAFDGDRRDHKKEEGASSTVSSSAASSEADGVDTTTNRGKRARDGERQSSERKRRVRGELHGGSVPVRGVSFDGVQPLGDVGRECHNLSAWCQSRRRFPSEPSVLPAPSYAAMAAPPPLHSGGYHLCAVCLLPASYRCVRCRRALFCSIGCHVTHDATRCMKFIV
ncbi:uncharacterized protein Tco025E_09063 [Trypanosoma conorhini]|uniref:HIT-type domain-containing protein n=1 Tax=Trypanosoma conorhini TaxID=83891 RepID=A0A422N162_9TRYP|nr:uncharacterized protein Tco025E_09063 [Trypanosoma conorhini]RNE99194.1 hypothetical protein Tco025E_09063 [Trypanosoma conorhini]